MSLTIKEQSDQLKTAAAGHLPTEVAEIFAANQARFRGGRQALERRCPG